MLIERSILKFFRILVVCSIVTTLVCLSLSFLLFDSMRKERKMYEERMNQMYNACQALVDEQEEISKEKAKKYHKSGWEYLKKEK